MDQQCLKPKDLEPMIGQRNRVFNDIGYENFVWLGICLTTCTTARTVAVQSLSFWSK